ncbi:MAG TPA: hypothetical protein VFK30_07790, partial [Anaerolineae bacterium]|nr:hypothetical protein [Anaerolineae bacterium]
MGAAAWLVISAITHFAGESSVMREAVGVIGAAIIGVIIYIAAMSLMRANELKSIWRIVVKRRAA